MVTLPKPTPAAGWLLAYNPTGPFGTAEPNVTITGYCRQFKVDPIDCERLNVFPGVIVDVAFAVIDTPNPVATKGIKVESS
jgi:hypothetical protein